MERYLARNRARLGGASALEIMAEHDPVKLKTVLHYWKKVMAEHDPVKLKVVLHYWKKDGKEGEWQEEVLGLVYKAVLGKFQQNKKLKEALLSTGTKTLGEASPRDMFWGIGVSLRFKSVLNRKAWKGKNVLGRSLMEAREELRS